MLGYQAIGGRDFGRGASVANHTQLQSVSDVIANNVGDGGVFAVAGQGDSPDFANGVTGNSVDLQFFDTVFTTGSGLENGTLDEHSFTRSDLFVIAALAKSGVSTVGPGNTLPLLIRHAQSDGAPGAFVAQNTNFPDPAGSNTVLIQGSDVAIQRTNSNVPVPIYAQ